MLPYLNMRYTYITLINKERNPDKVYTLQIFLKTRNNSVSFICYRLTAFVLKSFAQANQFIFVSDTVLYDAAKWIVMYQRTDGSFPTVGAVHSTGLRVSTVCLARRKIGN